MIEGKGQLLIVYFSLLLVACALPFALALRPTSKARWPVVALSASLCVVSVWLAWTRPALGLLSPLVLALLFLTPLSRVSIAHALGGLSVLSLFAGATWWDLGLRFSPIQAAGFVTLGMTAAAAPLLFRRSEGIAPLAAWPILTGVALAAMAMTGQFQSTAGFWSVWHHWGAYVSPAEALLAGGVAFRDFPIQYGLGPTLLIASLCGNTCYQGAYVAAGILNAIYLIALGGAVLALTRRTSSGVGWLCLIAMIVATVLWTGYPPDEMGPLLAPSVGGMRFAPVALLLCHVIHHGHRTQSHSFTGYMLWLLGLAWSPESAFFATVIWWPWLGLGRLQALESPRLPDVARAIGSTALRAAAATAAAVGSFSFGFKIAFADWPSLAGYMTYIRNPPGLLPINPLGPVWLLAATIGILAVSMTHADRRRQRQSSVCLIALIAVGSYYVGRSHDNNLLNLFPFIVLALTAALTIGRSAISYGAAYIGLVCVVAWPMSFGFTSFREAKAAGRGMDLGGTALLDTLRFDPEAQRFFDRNLANIRGKHGSAADAARALAWLDERNAPRPVFVNMLMLLPSGQPGNTWTGMNNIGNFALLPADVIRHFIKVGANNYKKPGWLLVDRSFSEPWVGYYTESYKITEEKMFGDYAAYRLAPK